MFQIGSSFLWWLSQKLGDKAFDATTEHGQGIVKRKFLGRRYPPLADASIKRVKGSHVYHNVTPTQYSDHVSEIIQSRVDHQLLSSVQTTCTFEPFFFYNKIVEDMKSPQEDVTGQNATIVREFEGLFNAQLATMGRLTAPTWTEDSQIVSAFGEVFLRSARRVFPHFSAMNEPKFAKRVRILILKDDDRDGFAARNPYYTMVAFERFLNAGVACCVATAPDLRASGFSTITDYCVINNEYLVDYYEDSEILLIIDKRKNVQNARYFDILKRHNSNLSHSGTASTHFQDLRGFMRRAYPLIIIGEAQD